MLNEFLFTKIEEDDIGNIWFQQDGALSAAEQMSFGHFEAEICHRWTIICGVPSKISVTRKARDNWRLKEHWWNTAAYNR